MSFYSRLLGETGTIRKNARIIRDKAFVKIKQFWKYLGEICYEKAAGSRGRLLPYLEDKNYVLRSNGKHPYWKIGFDCYYSQAGQDFFVDFLLNGKSGGVYLDIGGNDPIKINNTYYFEKKGWDGLAFEPLRKYQKKWEEERKVKCLPIALSNTNGTMIFGEARKDYLSRRYSGSLVKGVDENEAEFVESYEVQVMKLSDVLEEYGYHSIDFMSLDVEGMEYEILEGVDWNKEDIKIICIENEDGFTEENRIRLYMYDKGYTYIARLTNDDIFIKHSYFNRNV